MRLGIIVDLSFVMILDGFSSTESILINETNEHITNYQLPKMTKSIIELYPIIKQIT